jgi:hypothetical protein
MVVGLIKWYQREISSIKPRCCRFMPSCSEYAIMVVEKYGVIRGGAKATWRIIRCNPLNKNIGVDLP